MRYPTRLGLAALVSVTGLFVACGSDNTNNNGALPIGGNATGGGGNPGSGGGGAAGTVTGGTVSGGTFSMAGTGGDVGGTGGGTAGTGGAAAGMAGTGGNPPAIVPTVFLIDNIRLQLKMPSCGTGGTGGTGGSGGTGGGGSGGGGAGGTGGGGTGGGGTGGTGGGGAGGGGAGGTAGSAGTAGSGGTGVIACGGSTGGGGAGGTGGTGGGGTDSGGTGGGGAGGGGAGGTAGSAGAGGAANGLGFPFTFDANTMPLAANGNGFSPGPGNSGGPAIANATLLTWEPLLGRPGGAAKISVPFTVATQQADFGASFTVQGQDLTGYELLADVNMTDTGDVGACATAWMYVYGGNGYANDHSGEPASGQTSHLVKGQWTTVRLDLDGPYGFHASGTFKPQLVNIWGIQLNTWGCP